MAFPATMIIQPLVVDEWNGSVEHWWKNTDTKNPNYLDRNLSKYHFHLISYKVWPGIETKPSRKEAGSMTQSLEIWVTVKISLVPSIFPNPETN